MNVKDVKQGQNTNLTKKFPYPLLLCYYLSYSTKEADMGNKHFLQI